MLRKSTRFAVSEMSRTSVLSSKGNTNFLLRDRFCRTKLGRCSPLRYVVLLREASSVCVRRILGYQYRFPHRGSFRSTLDDTIACLLVGASTQFAVYYTIPQSTPYKIRMMFHSSKVLLFVSIFAMSAGGVNADVEIEDLLPRKIYSNVVAHDVEGEEHRSLQVPSCNNYQYTVEIRDDLRMSYVVTGDRIKIELEYDGEAWIGLGTNPNRDGKMVGSEAWIYLPDLGSKPVTYNLKNKRLSGARSASNQTLENSLVSQIAGVTLMQFDKLLSDGDNVAINGNGNVVFIWAIGSDNNLGKHDERGAFRLDLEPCTLPSLIPKEVELDVVCGLLGLSIFCPISKCGVFGRLIGLC